jgi:aryl-alcohol dehydrogenase-like predicted oxidoreductase
LIVVAAVIFDAGVYGGAMAQFSIAWCLRNTNVSTVITGATTSRQVKENMESAEFVERMDSRVLKSVSQVLEGKPQLESD